MSVDATKVIPSYEDFDVDADIGIRHGDTTISEEVRVECDRCDIVESHVACGQCCCKVTFFRGEFYYLFQCDLFQNAYVCIILIAFEGCVRNLYVSTSHFTGIVYTD